MRQQESATITVVDHTPMLLMPSFADDIMTAVGSRSTHSDSERSAMTSKTTTFTKGAGKLERFPIMRRGKICRTGSISTIPAS